VVDGPARTARDGAGCVGRARRAGGAGEHRAKAWERIDRISPVGLRRPERVLVTGAGPIGLLAALWGVQRGLDVHVLDIVTEGPKPALVASLGASYHHGDVADAATEIDIVVECTGVGGVVSDAITSTATAGIVCLTGVNSGGRQIAVDALHARPDDVKVVLDLM
jgi:glucose 1-dehydrogenase